MPSRPDESALPLTFTLNGRPVRTEARPKRSALDVLREGLDLRSLKPGCSPQGICGCCATLIDDKVRLTCTLPSRSLEGKNVTTLDGLSETARAQLARAFAESGSLRCGYCVPGIAMQTHALLQRLPEPSDEDIGKALSGHLCRCTGWSSLFDAVRSVAEARKNQDSSPFIDARRELALGEVAFIDDLSPPGLLHGALVWTPAPRGRVIRIDASKALAIPGVHAVLTAEDLPSAPEAGQRPTLVAVGAETRCVADALALVIADTRELAYGARDLVEVEFEALPPTLDVNEAAREPANILAKVVVSLGALNTALDTGGLSIAKAAFKTQRVEPAFVEAEAALAAPMREGALHVLSCGELPGEDLRALAQILAISPDKLTVEGVSSGGAFGAKLALNVQPLAALGARRTGRPVKVSLDMEEGMRLHPKRSPLSLRLMLGATADGAFLGLKALVIADVGGYGAEGVRAVQAMAQQVCGPYTIPNVEVEIRAVATNNPLGGARFGAGIGELAFALEGCIDRLAQQLGVDPLELRARNLADAAMRPALEALRPEYLAAKAEGLPLGIACAGVSAAFNAPVEVALVPQKTGEVLIHTAFSDAGQGLHAALVAQAATLTGLPAARFVPGVDAQLAGGAAHAGWTVALCTRALAAVAFKAGRAARGAWPPTPGTLSAGTAVLAVLNRAGGVQKLVVASPEGADPALLRSGAIGAAHMGLGAALSEDMATTGGVPDTRLRNLGVIKAANTPTIEVVWHKGALCEAESADLAVAGVAPAIAAALNALDGQWRTQLPMKDNPAAWSVGVRKTRGPAA